MLLFLIFSTNIKLVAQPDPHFNHIAFNQAIVNPGYAGSGNNGLFNIIALNRNQTANFEGAPVTTVVNVNGPLMLGSVNSGVSLSLFMDKQGYLNTPGFNIGYAYRLSLAKGTLGLGISLGALVSVLDPPTGGWRLPDTPEDEAIPTQKSSKTSFDAGLGAYYESDKWFAGVSCTHLTQPAITGGGEAAKLKPDFYLATGYKFTFPANTDIELMPSLFVSTDWASTLYSVNAQMMYKRKFWGGIAYRFKSSVGAMVGLTLFEGLKLGYSYDYSTSSLSRFSNGSHEIMLSYSFLIDTKKGKQKFKSIRYL